jgi:hypothetical protein
LPGAAAAALPLQTAAGRRVVVVVASYFIIQITRLQPALAIRSLSAQEEPAVPRAILLQVRGME